MRTLVLDNTETWDYFSMVKGVIDENLVDAENSTDRAMAKLNKNSYELVVMSDISGKASIYEVVDTLKASKLNKRTAVLLIIDNPTKARRIEGYLKGRKFQRFKSNETESMRALLERI